MPVLQAVICEEELKIIILQMFQYGAAAELKYDNKYLDRRIAITPRLDCCFDL